LVEGNYITTAKFVQRLIKNIGEYNNTLMSEEWAALSVHEKANINRTAIELLTIIGLYVLVSALFKDDDDDDRFADGFGEYQMERLITELSFFTRVTEAMKLLRSPAASMSVLENTGRWLNDMFNFNEYYERGPWAGQRKVVKSTTNLVPLYKQYYRLKDVRGSIVYLK
jgi:hypothetical protein